jgi:hypothetical protein
MPYLCLVSIRAHFHIATQQRLHRAAVSLNVVSCSPLAASVLFLLLLSLTPHIFSITTTTRATMLDNVLSALASCLCCCRRRNAPAAEVQPLLAPPLLPLLPPSILFTAPSPPRPIRPQGLNSPSRSRLSRSSSSEHEESVVFEGDLVGMSV